MTLTVAHFYSRFLEGFWAETSAMKPGMPELLNLVWERSQRNAVHAREFFMHG